MAVVSGGDCEGAGAAVQPGATRRPTELGLAGCKEAADGLPKQQQRSCEAREDTALPGEMMRHFVYRIWEILILLFWTSRKVDVVCVRTTCFGGSVYG